MRENVNSVAAVTEKQSASFRLPNDFAYLHNIENIIPINPIGGNSRDTPIYCDA